MCRGGGHLWRTWVWVRPPPGTDGLINGARCARRLILLLSALSGPRTIMNSRRRHHPAPAARTPPRQGGKGSDHALRVVSYLICNSDGLRGNCGGGASASVPRRPQLPLLGCAGVAVPGGDLALAATTASSEEGSCPPLRYYRDDPRR